MYRSRNPDRSTERPVPFTPRIVHHNAVEDGHEVGEDQNDAVDAPLVQLVDVELVDRQRVQARHLLSYAVRDSDPFT